MARVPVQVTPDVAASPTPPSDYQHIDATPASFGGAIGAAEQRTGGQADQAANDAAQSALLIQNRFNQTATDDAYNKFQNAASDLTFGVSGDPSKPGLYSLKGEAALRAGPGALKSLDDTREQIKAGLQNDAQRLLFDQASRRLQTFTASSIGNHLQRQSEEYSKNVTEAGMANGAMTAGQNYNNDDFLMHTASDQGTLATNQARLTNGQNADPAIITAAQNHAYETVFRSAYEGAVAHNDIGRAQEILTKFGHFMSPPVLEALTQHLKGVGDNISVASFGSDVPSRLRGGAPPTLPGSVSTDQIGAAIYGQESSSGKNTATSVTGATGGYQIEPGTFAQYVHTGENLKIDNAADNAVVGKRIISDLAQKFNNDPARIAVGYFSGPGNVSPPGSPTPWVTDKADATGKKTSSYVEDIMTRLGAGPSATSYADEQSLIQQKQAEAEQKFPGRPDLQHRAMSGVYEQISQNNALEAKREAEQAKVKRDSQQSYMNSSIDTIVSDPTKFDVHSVIASPLDPAQRENLLEFAKRRMTESGIDDTAPYGAGYAKAYNDIIAPADSPTKINDINDIIKRGAPGGDLTGIGVQKLAQIFTESRKDPDQLSIARSEASLLNYAKSHLSFEEDTGPVKIRDPKGEDLFNARFVPDFERQFAAVKATGDKLALDKFLNKETVDKMVQNLRSPTQMAQDRLAATGQTSPQDVEKPGTPLPPPPTGLNPAEWTSIIGAPPTASTGQPFTHAAWAEVLKRLAADPEHAIPFFNQRFGAAGYDGAELVKRLKATAEPALPHVDISSLDTGIR
jgi:hypothetical protein